MEQTMTSVSGGGSTNRRENSFFQAWLVLMLSIVFGVCLAAVHVNFSDVIAANKFYETLERIPELVRAEPIEDPAVETDKQVDIIPGTVAVEKNGRTSYYPLFRVSRNGEISGWVIKAVGPGYAGRIELLVGLDPTGDIITGLFVLQQKETPGLGNKITLVSWRNQFIGKKTTNPLVVSKVDKKKPDTIDAISGATISSRSVTAIVNRMIMATRGRLTPANIRYSKRRF